MVEPATIHAYNYSNDTPILLFWNYIDLLTNPNISQVNLDFLVQFWPEKLPDTESDWYRWWQKSKLASM